MAARDILALRKQGQTAQALAQTTCLAIQRTQKNGKTSWRALQILPGPTSSQTCDT